MSKSDHPSFHVRVPPDLLKRIKLASVENGRSMTVEILARLERSFVAEDQDRERAVRLLAEALSLLDRGNKE
ncbi:Arc family DNA-binding protein [Mesorhizobium soli]